jgi:hypothetical protein
LAFTGILDYLDKPDNDTALMGYLKMQFTTHAQAVHRVIHRLIHRQTPIEKGRNFSSGRW